MSRRSAKQRCLWISFNVFPVRLRLSLVEIGKEFCLIVGKRTRNRRTSYTYERRERDFLLRDSFYLISTLFIITFSLFPSRSLLSKSIDFWRSNESSSRITRVLFSAKGYFLTFSPPLDRDAEMIEIEARDRSVKRFESYAVLNTFLERAVLRFITQCLYIRAPIKAKYIFSFVLNGRFSFRK